MALWAGVLLAALSQHARAQSPEALLAAPELSFEEQNAREYSDLERRIAREVIATGQMLEGNPEFEDVVSVLSRRGRAMLPSGAGVTQDWVREQLSEILPEFKNEMAAAALDAATREVASGTGTIANSVVYNMTGISGGQDYSAAGDIKQTAIRSALEGLRAAAAVSDIAALNRLELEYSLSEGGIDEYSLLTVQPLWDSADLRHNVFAQGSFANKEVPDLEADTSGRRETLNAGLAYRYISPDEQHMFGGNIFFDHQWPYHHNRMSLGLDYKTSLYGVAFNKYVGLSDWRGRDDGYEEKALSGEDIELSGRLPDLPNLEFFAKGYHWSQEATDVVNPGGDDIWGYQLAGEYTPLNALTIRAQGTRDNAMDGTQAEVTLRLNYTFGEPLESLWQRPDYDLTSVLDRRFDKVRRQNEIRVQVRQDPSITARVTFAQGANVSVGQIIAFGATITTDNNGGDGATVVFGDGAILDIGRNTQVRVENDRIVLISGLIQFTSAEGGITVIAVPNGTINLIGTDVDVRVSGTSNTLRVRDGAADFTDDSGTTRVNAEQLAEATDGDGTPPVLRGEAELIFDTHTSEAHTQLNLVGPAPTNPKAAPFADEAVSITGTLESGNTLTFSVPTTATVNVTGTPQLRFTLGGLDRFADYDSGSNPLVFTYDVTGADELLSNIITEEIEKTGGATLIGTNGAPMVRTVSGTLSGTVPDATAPTLDSSTPADEATDVIVGNNIVLTFSENVQAGTGNIVITDTNDGTGTQTIAIGDAQITIAGATVTINPTTDLEGGETFEIIIAAGVIEDTNGNDFAGLASGDLNFTTETTEILGLTACPAGALSVPADLGCARNFDAPAAPTTANVGVFAGYAPDAVPPTGIEIFVSRCNMNDDGTVDWTGAACAGGDVMSWDAALDTDIPDVATGSTIATTPRANDGRDNTDDIIADGIDADEAARVCRTLGADWYLPAIGELDVIYANLPGPVGDADNHPRATVNSGGGGAAPASFTDSDDNADNLSDTFGFWINNAAPGNAEFYWSSSEGINGIAWGQRFSDGFQSFNITDGTFSVRCVRRD